MADDLGIAASFNPLTGQLGRYDLEPKNSLASGFARVAQAVSSPVANMLSGGGMDVMSQFMAAIEEQKYWQYQMQMVSLISNTEKSRHECEMIPLRNISVR